MGDILKDRQLRDYNSLSRYASVPFYYNEKDNKYIYGLCRQLSTQTDYSLHQVKSYDTLETLALYYYGRPDYYWIIADFNRITDSFIKLSDRFTEIKIPSISYIYYEG